MKKLKGAEAWGRSTARKRYAHGGPVNTSFDEPVPESAPESPLEVPAADRTAEIDEFISQVMRDQIKKMQDD